jgi:hypothetical protein
MENTIEVQLAQQARWQAHAIRMLQRRALALSAPNANIPSILSTINNYVIKLYRLRSI